MERLLLRLANLQIRRPLVVIVLVLATLIPAGRSASRLTLKTAFTELLPDSKPSVIEMRRVSSRLQGNSTLSLVAEGESTEALKKFVDAMTPRLMALGPDLVGSVDDGTRHLQKFFEANKHLYADIGDIRQLREEIVSAYDAEVSRASGMDLGLDDEVPKKISVDDIVGRLEKKANDAKKSSPGVDGYYISADGKLAAILIRTPFGSGDQRVFELERRIEALIKEIRPEQWDPKMHFGFTGNLLTSAEQQKVITEDLTNVGIWGVGLILGVVFLYFLQLRTLLAMTLTIGVGCVWAFGAAYHTVGMLNTATGFLASIIAGNGINFSIMFMARYVEARRNDALGVEDAIRTAHSSTWAATLSAAAAAGIAYGSLSITDFRGFKHFGIIGGVGMLLCWVATYLLLPAILVVTERILPMFRPGEGPGLAARLSGQYGRPFAWVVRRASKPVTALAAALGVVSLVLTVAYFRGDPMEYDLKKIRNDDVPGLPARLLSFKVDQIVGRTGQDGRAIVLDRVDQVQPLVDELERRRNAAPKGKEPFSKVVSVYSLIPGEQEEKIALLGEIKTRVLKARARHFVSDADWERLKPHIPERLSPIGLADLPDELVRPFQTKDGARGTVVYIAPAAGQGVYDARYLMRWADAFREVKLPNGEVIHGSGDPVIFADMLIAIEEEAPKAVTLSVIGTILVILVAFRGRVAGAVTFAALLLGLTYLVAFLALDGIRLNFLNFVALPISVGVGADYALNIMKRRQKNPLESVETTVFETGGAVMLCSLTTTLGYLALMLSINRAVRSFGLAAAVGEVTTLVAAVVVLPAVLRVASQRPNAPSHAPQEG